MYKDTFKSIYSSIMRNMPKLLILFGLGFLDFYLVDNHPLVFGETMAPLLRGFGLIFMGLAAGYLAQCIIDPHVSSRELIQKATRENNVAASLIFVGRALLIGLILILAATSSRADTPPQAAISKLPILKQELKTYWPSLVTKSFIGAQIEQETCASLKSKSCWNEGAELHTSREQGVGLGQITRAFFPDGKVRFDSMSELKAKHPIELKDWSWTNWKDARLQLRGVVLKDRDTCDRITATKTQLDQLRMCMVAYNAGYGGLQSDRLACRAKPGCDHGVWYGNVELTSLRSKVVIPGYGRSPYQISREYVRNIDVVRQPRYLILNI